MPTLFEKYENAPSIPVLVTDFYNRVLETDHLAPFFENIDMDRLVVHQTMFLTMVLGGPDAYTGRAMREAHKGLNICARDFDAIVDLLGDTLEDNDVSDEDIHEIIANVRSLKDTIITQSSV
ncbi:MAG: hemoglobin [Kiritimatiellia bacterium]|jgi:hemoglobin